MKRKPIIIFTGIVLLVLAIALIFFYQKQQTPQQSSQASLVSVATAIEKNVAVEVDAIGTVEPYSTVAIRSLVDGELERVGFLSGDDVKKGELLFSIDARPYEAQLAQAKAAYASNEAQLNNAKAVLKRNEKLHTDGYVSPQAYDEAKTNVETYQAAIMADEAAVKTAQLQVDYARIISPINGRAGEILLNEGNLVKANDLDPLVKINQISPIYVQFYLPEEDLLDIKRALKAGEVTVIAKANKGGEVLETGKLTFIDNAVDTTTGRIMLKATFDNDQETLWPGQFVTVQLPIKHLEEVVMVPSQSLLTGQKGPYVYVIDEENNAIFTSVLPGKIIADDIVLEEGVAPGAKVVTDGQLNLMNGRQVRYERSL